MKKCGEWMFGHFDKSELKVDENGNISVAISGTNDPDGKIAKENAERKVKENREKEEKVKEKRGVSGTCDDIL